MVLASMARKRSSAGRKEAQSALCLAAPGAALGDSALNDLLGGGGAPSPGSGFLNSTVQIVEAPPGLAQNYAAAGQQHTFDALPGASVGRSGQPSVSCCPATAQDTLLLPMLRMLRI